MSREPAPGSPGGGRAAAILGAAATAFSDRGFAATSMREIAAGSGASVGTIYYHFDSKKEILRSLICDNLRRVNEALDGRLCGDERPREALEILVENHTTFLAGHLAETRVMSNELDTLDGEAGREVAELRRAYFRRLTSILGDLRPDLKEADVQLAALSLFGMLDWTHRWLAALPHAVEPTALGRRLSRLFLEGFLDGARQGDGDRLVGEDGAGC